eukprot:gene6466-2223_t
MWYITSATTSTTTSRSSTTTTLATTTATTRSTSTSTPTTPPTAPPTAPATTAAAVAPLTTTVEGKQADQAGGQDSTIITATTAATETDAAANLNLTAASIRALNKSVEELLENGFSPTQLIDAGYTKSDLIAAGLEEAAVDKAAANGSTAMYATVEEGGNGMAEIPPPGNLLKKKGRRQFNGSAGSAVSSRVAASNAGAVFYDASAGASDGTYAAVPALHMATDDADDASDLYC